MNVHKHMEAVFVVTLAIIGVGEYLFDSMPDTELASTVAVAEVVATAPAMPVVVVHAPKSARHA
jgi:hypothetical protein